MICLLLIARFVVVRCLSIDVRCSLLVVCRLSFSVRCSLLFDCCPLCVVFMFVVLCYAFIRVLVLATCCLLFVVCCVFGC